MSDYLIPCPFCGGSPEQPVDATRIRGVWRLLHRCNIIGPIEIEGFSREAVVKRWNFRAKPSDSLLAYVLQDDELNRETPRLIDISYSAFMSGRSGKNKDNGGPCDWFNDTRPMVIQKIGEIQKALIENGAEAIPEAPEETQASLGPRLDSLVKAMTEARPHLENMAQEWPEARAILGQIDAALTSIMAKDGSKT